MTNATAEQISEAVLFLKKERPLFEENYIKLGGNLNGLKWSECSDGTGDYQPDWENQVEDESLSIDEKHHVDAELQDHAEHVSGCLMSWIECAKSKTIPEGYYLMPIQPSKEMLEKAKEEFDGLDIDDLEDRIVFSHQAMVDVAARSQVK